MLTHRRNKLAAAMVAFPFLIAVLAGCTSAAPTGQTSPSSSSASSASSFDDYDLAFAECMRDQGVDFADPGADGSTSAGINDPATVAAIETCIDDLGPAPAAPGAGSDQDRHEADLEVAACLRENGIDIPDPQPGTGLTLPMDTPREVLAECVGNGVPGAVAPGSN